MINFILFIQYRIQRHLIPIYAQLVTWMLNNWSKYINTSLCKYRHTQAPKQIFSIIQYHCARKSDCSTVHKISSSLIKGEKFKKGSLYRRIGYCNNSLKSSISHAPNSNWNSNWLLSRSPFYYNYYYIRDDFLNYYNIECISCTHYCVYNNNTFASYGVGLRIEFPLVRISNSGIIYIPMC